MKWLKRPLLAAVAALTAVGLGIPCAMAEGTAAATAYITVTAASGTTLNGRTYRAYRLGSYGKADMRTDADSGDRYAASIPVSTDPDRAGAVADAGAKAGFDGSDMLAAAWASTDSARLEAFARALAASLADAEPAATLDGAGEMGPFTPGVYLVSGSDGSVCLTGTLPSEGVGDRRHALGIAEFTGDAQAAVSPQANSDGALTTLDAAGGSGSPIATYAAPTATYHRLFDGTVTSTALDNEDPAISIYTGGNLNYMNNLEVEGSVIVNGNLTNGQGLVSGKVNWGMGYTPPKNSVMLAIGGDYTSRSTTDGNNWHRGYTSGRAQIGGSDNRVVPLDSQATVSKYGMWGTWFIDGQTGVKSTSNMGHDAALKVDIDGKGTIVDYNDYVSRQLQPLSTQLANETPTGTVSYRRGPTTTENVWLQLKSPPPSPVYGDKDTVTVTGDEGVITFTGDGKKHTQVFELDMDELEAQRKALNLLQWGVDFENVPGDTAIVVNVRGAGSRTWNTGWRYWVNGKQVNIAVNQTDGAYQDFRQLASRVLWNWTDATFVKYDESHGIMHIGNGGHSKAQDGKESYEGGPYGTAASPGKASNLPGTVLAPKANVRVRCDQNGRLLVGKDLTLDVWEHHNNPWIGFNDNNSVTVDAATTAVHDGVDVGTTKSVHDSISLRNNGRKYGAAAAKATVTLNYSASANGKTADRKVSKATGAIQMAAGRTVSANSPDFTPADLKMDSWQPGRYWFDLSVAESDLSVTGTASYETADVNNISSLSGLTDPSEQWTIAPTGKLSISTKAMAGSARVGGTQPVHDSITVTNSDPSRAVSIAKVTTTLHMRTGNRSTSKTVGPVTIPAGGSKTFDSKDFVPSDLKRKCWSAKTDYWFDATVATADATYPSGAKALSADLVHDGRNDKAQHFALTFADGPNNFSTQAQNTFSTAGGTAATHDRLFVTTGADSVAEDLSVKVTLNWNASATGTTATKTSTKGDVFPAGSAYKDLKDFTPADLGMTNGWLAGRYWYDVVIPAQDGVDGTITLDGLKKDVAKESWVVAEPTAALTTKTDALSGLTDLSATAVHDTVTARTTGYPANSTFAATLTLNYRAADGTTAKARPVTFKAAVNGSTKSPDVAPSAFGWKTWRIGHYWFDLSAVDPNGKTITVPGADDANEQFDVANHTTKATLAITTQASKGTASTTNADPVHDTVRIAATGAALTVARVHVRLNYPKADGTTTTAVKDTGAVKVPANGAASVDSPAFTPADLGMGDLWADNTAGTSYWFDVWVDKADVTLSGDTGVLQLSGSLSHEGKADAAERFRLDRQTGKATTTAAGTFARAGGTAATHDVLHLAFPGAKTLKVTSTLNYAASDTAVKADASKAKAATVAANGDVAGPTFTPADFGWSAWKAGRYWYDLDVPTQAGCNALTVEGLTDKAEQWTAVVPYTLDLAKLAYIGQPGQGRWSNEPVKGATFTLTETTDRTGSTAKPGTAPKTVTTDADGSAHLLDGMVGADGTRWFKLTETKAPASYEMPSTGAYWMIGVTGGSDKAAVTVTGSNAEAKALLKGMNGTTVTVGNQLEGNIMPPMTGGRYDVARAGALAGLVTLGALIAGVVVLRRRESNPNR